MDVDIFISILLKSRDKKGESKRYIKSRVTRDYTASFSSSQTRKQKIMRLGKSTRKVSNFLHKTLRSFKSICFKDYQKLPNTPISSPFSYTKDSLTDEFYFNPADEQKSECQNAKKTNAMVPVKSLTAQQASYESPHQREQKQKARCPRKQERQFSDVGNKGGCKALEQRMKDLDMMNLKDVEHVSDVKEAIRCYSMIRSPVYLDIVDNFFMDMYREFSHPLTSSSLKDSTSSGLKGSRRRAGSFRL